MAIVIILVIIILAFIYVKKSGGNFSRIAKNIACIYQAISTNIIKEQFTLTQLYYLVVAVDMGTYLKLGQIDFETILQIARAASANAGTDEVKNVANLARYTMYAIFRIDTKADAEVIVRSVNNQYSNIVRTIKKEFAKDPNRKRCQMWQNSASYWLMNEEFITYFMQT